MITRFSRLILVSAFALSLAGCGSSALTLRSDDGSRTVNVKVEVADSQKERERGLMERPTMEPDSGMIFVFPDPQILKFWMKDTKIPLDILFFDEKGAFVSYTPMQPCIADPCPIYSSAALSSYAIETNKGFRDAHQIGVGWTLDLNQVRRISHPS